MPSSLVVLNVRFDAPSPGKAYLQRSQQALLLRLHKHGREENDDSEEVHLEFS